MLRAASYCHAQEANLFQGSIPSFAALTGLTAFVADQNQLSGPMPDTWLTSPYLIVFSVQFNSAPFPAM